MLLSKHLPQDLVYRVLNHLVLLGEAKRWLPDLCSLLVPAEG